MKKPIPVWLLNSFSSLSLTENKIDLEELRTKSKQSALKETTGDSEKHCEPGINANNRRVGEDSIVAVNMDKGLKGGKTSDPNGEMANLKQLVRRKANDYKVVYGVKRNNDDKESLEK
ncbi:hypothetical protein S245_045029 [Arachis hypogaea]